MSSRLVKFGANKKAQFLKLLSEGGRRYASAKAVGVSYETIRLHLHKEPEFAAQIDEAEMEANQLVEDAMFQAARSGNVTACQVWLYNRDPEHWKDQRNVKQEITGANGQPLFNSESQRNSLTNEDSIKNAITLQNRLVSLAAVDVRNGSERGPLEDNAPLGAPEPSTNGHSPGCH